MLAKLTSKNQLTLPKAAVEATGNAEYFEIEARAGQLLLTPVRLQRANAVRAKLAELGLDDEDLAAAAAWARSSATSSKVAQRAAEEPGDYPVTATLKRKPATRRSK